MAAPGFVYFINSIRPVIMTTVTHIVTTVTPETVSPSAIFKSGTSIRTGKFFAAEPNIKSAAFCSK